MRVLQTSLRFSAAIPFSLVLLGPLYPGCFIFFLTLLFTFLYFSPASVPVILFSQLSSLVAQVENRYCDPNPNLPPLLPEHLFNY